MYHKPPTDKLTQVYFNTTHQDLAQVTLYEELARNQNDAILDIFIQLRQATPSQVARYFNRAPLTSIRRGINNLTRDGKLIKTSRTAIGPYGRPEYVWSLNA